MQRTPLATTPRRRLTGGYVDAGDGNAATDHGLYDGGHVGLGCRTAEAAAEQRVDDEVVGAVDEVRLAGHVRQERHVLQLALVRQSADERRLADAPREKDRRTIVLQQSTNHHAASQARFDLPRHT